MSRFQRMQPYLNRILPVVVLIYQVMALSAFMVSIILAFGWLKLPFLGAFFEHTLAYNGAVPSQTSEAWQLYNEGIKLGDQLVSIAGTEVHNTSEIKGVLQNYYPGESIQVGIQLTDGSLHVFGVTLQSLPSADVISYLIIPSAISFIFLLISGWIFGLRRNESAGRAFTLLAASLTIVTGTLFDLFTTHYLTHLWTLAVAMVGAAMFDLALVFPQEPRLVVRYPFLRWLGYLAALILTGYAYTTLFNMDRPIAYIQAWQIMYLFVAISGLFFFGSMIYRMVSSPSPIVKSQARTILIGGLLAFSPIIVWLVLSPFELWDFSTLLFIPVILFPLATGYTILRFRQVNTDYLVSRGILFTLMTLLVALIYALLVAGLTLIFGDVIPASNPWLIGGMIAILALLIQPLRERMQNLINIVFFRGERAYQKRVQDFTHELTTTVDLSDVLQTLRRHILETLIPERLHIYVYDPLNDQYSAQNGEDGRPTSDIQLSSANPLVQAISREKLSLFIDRENLPPALQDEKARISLLGSLLFVPLPGGERLIGWLALGPRRSGENYTSADISFLELLSDQAAVAVERAQVISNMERRVREMNILSRVAQGVNVTVSYDDILELIYAQTDQIFSVDDFHITLHNKENDYFYFAFCLEGDERLPHRENLPLPPDTGLSPEVIRSRRTLITNDYARECQTRGITPVTSGTFAYAGVPLNAGAETIGSLSVASRDASVIYTPGQIELLQAIADQAAGAIIKARLLQETERRARQLATLNDITRQLTSTLETEPLLRTILESAVTILNCEAGSLFLVDEQTDELIFSVTVGGAGNNLIGQRLPPGSGIVGKAVASRLPVIENDVTSSSAWFNTDEKTGFTTKALLAVPMQVKERVIGVLEVINRQDGLPFVEDDKNLLTAFASQAAVALENARLYTLTDQELSARVEELSVMQRIDRELNASLDISRAMRITLEWAMRQSLAEAGLIGIVVDNGIRIMAQQGYEELSNTYKDSTMPLIQESMRIAVDTAQPQHLNLDIDHPGLLSQAVYQIVIPIRREASVIGLILLESTSHDVQPDVALNFLNRLGDHAAIAISNAQLYSEVEAANTAKSEFVSFVAHEIKNPMTSIKGYSELLSAGAVGSINDMQANFLNTIRSNVERMSTLVSDLNDNSKIEAGRLRLEFKAVDLADVVDEVVRSSSKQIEEKKQNLGISLPRNLPKVWADRTRLAQILTNFVSNAHKYTPEGGRIEVAAEFTDNKRHPDGSVEMAHIWVKDSGIGISLDDQKKIFQKFFRSDDQKAREAPGTGLGLNITKSLIEMQGGRVWFESEFRLGTTFHFTIPVAEG